MKEKIKKLLSIIENIDKDYVCKENMISLLLLEEEIDDFLENFDPSTLIYKN